MARQYGRAIKSKEEEEEVVEQPIVDRPQQSSEPIQQARRHRVLGDVDVAQRGSTESIHQGGAKPGQVLESDTSAPAEKRQTGPERQASEAVQAQVIANRDALNTADAKQQRANDKLVQEAYGETPMRTTKLDPFAHYYKREQREKYLTDEELGAERRRQNQNLFDERERDERSFGVAENPIKANMEEDAFLPGTRDVQFNYKDIKTYKQAAGIMGGMETDADKLAFAKEYCKQNNVDYDAFIDYAENLFGDKLLSAPKSEGAQCRYLSKALNDLGFKDTNGNDVDFSRMTYAQIKRVLNSTADDNKRNQAIKALQSLAKNPSSPLYGYEFNKSDFGYVGTKELSSTTYKTWTDKFANQFYAESGHEQENIQRFIDLAGSVVQKHGESGYAQEQVYYALQKAYEEQTGYKAPSLDQVKEIAAERVAEGQSTEQNGGLFSGLGEKIKAVFFGEKAARDSINDIIDEQAAKYNKPEEEQDQKQQSGSSSDGGSTKAAGPMSRSAPMEGADFKMSPALMAGGMTSDVGQTPMGAASQAMIEDPESDVGEVIARMPVGAVQNMTPEGNEAVQGPVRPQQNAQTVDQNSMTDTELFDSWLSGNVKLTDESRKRLGLSKNGDTWKMYAYLNNNAEYWNEYATDNESYADYHARLTSSDANSYATFKWGKDLGMAASNFKASGIRDKDVAANFNLALGKIVDQCDNLIANPMFDVPSGVNPYQFCIDNYVDGNGNHVLRDQVAALGPMLEDAKTVNNIAIDMANEDIAKRKQEASDAYWQGTATPGQMLMYRESEDTEGRDASQLSAIFGDDATWNRYYNGVVIANYGDKGSIWKSDQAFATEYKRLLDKGKEVKDYREAYAGTLHETAEELVCGLFDAATESGMRPDEYLASRGIDSPEQIWQMAANTMSEAGLKIANDQELNDMIESGEMDKLNYGILFSGAAGVARGISRAGQGFLGGAAGMAESVVYDQRVQDNMRKYTEAYGFDAPYIYKKEKLEYIDQQVANGMMSNTTAESLKKRLEETDNVFEVLYDVNPMDRNGVFGKISGLAETGTRFLYEGWGMMIDGINQMQARADGLSSTIMSGADMMAYSGMGMLISLGVTGATSGILGAASRYAGSMAGFGFSRYDEVRKELLDNGMSYGNATRLAYLAAGVTALMNAGGSQNSFDVAMGNYEMYEGAYMAMKTGTFGNFMKYLGLMAKSGIIEGTEEVNERLADAALLDPLITITTAYENGEEITPSLVMNAYADSANHLVSDEGLKEIAQEFMGGFIMGEVFNLSGYVRAMKTMKGVVKFENNTQFQSVKTASDLVHGRMAFTPEAQEKFWNQYLHDIKDPVFRKTIDSTHAVNQQINNMLTTVVTGQEIENRAGLQQAINTAQEANKKHESDVQAANNAVSVWSDLRNRALNGGMDPSLVNGLEEAYNTMKTALTAEEESGRVSQKADQAALEESRKYFSLLSNLAGNMQADKMASMGKWLDMQRGTLTEVLKNKLAEAAKAELDAREKARIAEESKHTSISNKKLSPEEAANVNRRYNSKAAQEERRFNENLNKQDREQRQAEADDAELYGDQSTPETPKEPTEVQQAPTENLVSEVERLNDEINQAKEGQAIEEQKMDEEAGEGVDTTQTKNDNAEKVQAFVDKTNEKINEIKTELKRRYKEAVSRLNDYINTVGKDAIAEDDAGFAQLEQDVDDAAAALDLAGVTMDEVNDEIDQEQTQNIADTKQDAQNRADAEREAKIQADLEAETLREEKRQKFREERKAAQEKEEAEKKEAQAKADAEEKERQEAADDEQWHKDDPDVAKEVDEKVEEAQKLQQELEEAPAEAEKTMPDVDAETVGEEDAEAIRQAHNENAVNPKTQRIGEIVHDLRKQYNDLRATLTDMINDPEAYGDEVDEISQVLSQRLNGIGYALKKLGINPIEGEVDTENGGSVDTPVSAESARHIGSTDSYGPEYEKDSAEAEVARRQNNLNTDQEMYDAEEAEHGDEYKDMGEGIYVVTPEQEKAIRKEFGSLGNFRRQTGVNAMRSDTDRNGKKRQGVKQIPGTIEEFIDNAKNRQAHRNEGKRIAAEQASIDNARADIEIEKANAAAEKARKKRERAQAQLDRLNGNKKKVPDKKAGATDRLGVDFGTGGPTTTSTDNGRTSGNPPAPPTQQTGNTSRPPAPPNPPAQTQTNNNQIQPVNTPQARNRRERRALQSLQRSFQRFMKDIGVGGNLASEDMDGSGPRRMGFTDLASRNIQARKIQSNDINIIAHEVGHAVQQQLNLDSSQQAIDNWRNSPFYQSTGMASGQWVEPDATTMNREAFAEFFWRYNVDRDLAVQYAGAQFVGDFENAMRNSGMWRSFERTLTNSRRFFAANLDERLSSMIRHAGDVDEDATARERTYKFLAKYVDDTAAGKILTDHLNDVLGRRATLEEDVAAAARLQKASLDHAAMCFTGDYLVDGRGEFVRDENGDRALSLMRRLQEAGFNGEDSEALATYLVMKQAYDVQRSREYELTRNGQTETATTRAHKVLPNIYGFMQDFYTQNDIDLSSAFSNQGLEQEIQRIEQLHPEFARAADAIHSWWHDMMDTYQVKPGFMKAETLQNLENMYPNYVPLRRKVTNEKSIRIRGLQGSTQDIINPIDSMINMANTMVAQEAANYTKLVAQNAYDAMLAHPDWGEAGASSGYYMREITSKDTQARDANGNPLPEQNYNQYTALRGGLSNRGNEIVVVQPNGGTRVFEVTEPELFRLLSSMPPEKAGQVSNLIGNVTRRMSQLTTGGNPFFALRNFMRDFQTSVNYGHWAVSYADGMIKWLRTFAEVASNEIDFVNRIFPGTESEMYQEYLAQGGGADTRYRAVDNESVMDYNKDLFGSYRDANGELHRGYDRANARRRAADIAEKGWKLITMEKLNNIVEQTSRYAEYRYGHHDLTTTQGKNEAFLASRDVTVDFGRRGYAQQISTMKNLIPFFNASMQGVYRDIRQFTPEEWNDGRARVRICKNLVNAALASAMCNAAIKMWADDDTKENFYFMSDNLKATHMYIPNFAPSVLGDSPLIRIPLEQNPLTALIAGGITNAFWGKGPDDEYAIRMASMGQAALDYLNPIQSTIFDPIVYGAIGNKTWYGSNVVPTYLQSYDPTQQYSEDTAKVFVAASEGLNRASGGRLKLSPMTLQYMSEQYTGFLGQVAIPILPTSISNSSLGRSAWNSVTNKFRTTLTSDPLKSNDVVSQVFNNYNFLTEVSKSGKAGKKLVNLRPGMSNFDYEEAVAEADAMKSKGGIIYEARKEISALYTEIDDIEKNDTLSEADKLRMQKERRQEMTRIALEANEEMGRYYGNYVTGGGFISNLFEPYGVIDREDDEF